MTGAPVPTSPFSPGPSSPKHPRMSGKKIAGIIIGVIVIATVAFGLTAWQWGESKKAKYSDNLPPPVKQPEKQVKEGTRTPSPVTPRESKKVEAPPAVKSVPEIVMKEPDREPEVRDQPEIVQKHDDEPAVSGAERRPKSLDEFGGKAAEIQLPSDPRAETLPVTPGEIADSIFKSLNKYEQVKSVFIPVLLYRISDDLKIYISAGTRYGDAIIAPESFLPKGMEAQYIGYVDLRPFCDKIAGYIESVKSGEELKGIARKDSQPNFVVMKIGNPKPIKGISERTLVSNMEIKYVKCPDGPNLQHLVSGKKAQVVGFGVNVNDNALYFLIEYEPLLGEKGTGFVDKNDDVVYTLVGQFMSVEDPKAIEERLGTSKNLAIVTEGLRFPK